MEKKWTCNVCTYKNYRNSNICVMCRVGEFRNALSSCDLVEVQIASLKTCDAVADINSFLDLKKKDIAVVDGLILSDSSYAADDSDDFVNEGDIYKKPFECCMFGSSPDSDCTVLESMSNGEISPTDSIELIDDVFNESFLLDDSLGDNIESVGGNIFIENVVVDEVDGKLKGESVKSEWENLCKPFKWICGECSYENWAKSKKCVICNVMPNEETLLVNENNIKNDTILDGSYVASALNQEISNKQINQADSRVNPEVYRFSQPFKWMCNLCTYENWPKASQCVICKAMKSQSAGPVDNSIVMKSNETGPKDGMVKAKPVNGKVEESNNSLESEDDFDWKWIGACVGVVNQDSDLIEDYFSNGGDPKRTLAPNDMALLKGLGNFKVGYNLLHIAVWNGSIGIAKNLPKELWLPSKDRVIPGVACPDIATRLFGHIVSIKELCCEEVPFIHLGEFSTFYLPREIDELSKPAQKKLWSDLLDQDIQQELDETVINWDEDIVERHGSKLFALWNQGCGDCILHSVLQCTYGTLDTENVLRTVLSDTILFTSEWFYPRWKDFESQQINELGYCLQEKQLDNEWEETLKLTSLPGTSLEPFHVLVLCHILRRPIIVYADKYVQSYTGDYLGLTRFGGIYLPYLCDSTTCYKSPLALGYTRGHLSALVPKESSCNPDVGKCDNDLQFLLPLVSSDGLFLPLPFATPIENLEPIEVYKRYLEVDVTDKGVLVAKVHIPRLSSIVSEMVYDWLSYFKLFDNPCSIES